MTTGLLQRGTNSGNYASTGCHPRCNCSPFKDYYPAVDKNTDYTVAAAAAAADTDDDDEYICYLMHRSGKESHMIIGTIKLNN